MRCAHHRRGRRAFATTERAQRDHGYILVEFAFLVVPLMLMVGLSVDVGYWYNRVSDIQKAADAAALAGVVWLPDDEKAEEYALAAAARNGFVDGADDVEIDIDPVGERRLRVTIRDTTVGSFFFQVLGGSTIDLARSGTAEYVLPVPLGSPRNYFGTGTLLASEEGEEAELLYQSVNPACTSKINGDRYQSTHYGPLDSGGASLSSCPTTATNDEYRDRGYELYIEAPEDRPANIDVLLYDPRYSTANVSYQVQDGQTCTIVYSPSGTSWTGPSGSDADITIRGPAQYQTRGSSPGWSDTVTLAAGSSYTRRGDRLRYRLAVVDYTPADPGWIGPAGSQYPSITVNGPAQYRTRSSGGVYSAVTTLYTGQSFTHRGDRLQYRQGTVRNDCQPNYVTVNEGGPDSKRKSGDESFTYTLYEPDLTPFDDSDNPEVANCTATYSASSAFDSAYNDYLGSRRWNKLCTITTLMDSGRYILRVENGAPGTSSADGSNQWGLVARYQGAAGNGLCDGRDDDMCPRVYGRDAISVYANTSKATAAFFLAEIPDYHAGKTLEIELWDPGEGGSKIKILQPTGTDSWSTHTFSWASFNNDGSSHDSRTNVSEVSVTNNAFNGRLLRIRIKLTGYDPPDDNAWWKIQYEFGTGDVTDRTTWSARVIGDPVHLVQE